MEENKDDVLKDNALMDETLTEMSGGIIYEKSGLDSDNLRRVKCICGEIFMANLKAAAIICPACHTDLKERILKQTESVKE